jgi:hypothetical protein
MANKTARVRIWVELAVKIDNDSLLVRCKKIREHRERTDRDRSFPLRIARSND